MIRLILVFIIGLAGNAVAGELTVPNVFIPGTPALADDVNQNFDAVEIAVNDNDARLDNLDRNSLDAADGAPLDALFVDNDGQVGIGTLNPQSDLDLVSSFPFYESENTIAGMRWRFGTNSDSNFHINKTTGTTYSPFIINPDGNSFFTRDSSKNIPEFPCTTVTINASIPGISGCIEGLMIADSLGGAVFIGHDTNPNQRLTLAWLGISGYGRLNTNGGPLVLQGGVSSDVGISTTTPSSKLHVNGTVTASAFVQASDARLKKNIRPIASSLDKISRLEGVQFEWNGDANPDYNLADGGQLGLVAQDVIDVVPEAVTQSGEEMYSVNYSMMVPLLIEAVKEQQAIIESLQAEVEKLSEGR